MNERGKLSIARHFDQVCDSFEDSWDAEANSTIESLVEGFDRPHRDRLLKMLVAIDIELRHKAGLQIDPNDYDKLGELAVAEAKRLAVDQKPEFETRSFAASDEESRAEHSNTMARVQPTQIGPYKLLEVIGEGGMGSVWMAEQDKPVRRSVAIKVIKKGVGSQEIITRFEAERQALAVMNHPNIARILDAGTTDDGQPYFAMELVQGLPLTTYCDQNRLGINERLALFAAVCSGVQHAHQKGIIHRDLKPSNILVTEVDGKPVPKVIDFGLAKALENTHRLTDQSIDTGIGQILGTLKYMSPEQAALDTVDIDTRTDIYALGVILHELLIGCTPLDDETLRSQGLLQVLELIREKEPVKPSRRLRDSGDSLSSITDQRRIDSSGLNRILVGDLDWIVVKALDKDRTRRYETANGLAVEIERYLNGDPVVARPPSRTYLMRKYVRKNKGLVASVVSMAALLLLGIIGTSYGMYRAGVNARRAESREEQAIDAVKRFRDAVADNPELKNNPALEELRKSLLSEPLAFFKSLAEQLQADGDTRPEALARLASASFELGVLTETIGDKRDALIAFQQAREVQQKLCDANPNDSQWLDDLGRSHSEIGLMHREIGNPREAIAADKLALEVRQKLAKLHPEVAEYRADVARSYFNLGVMQSEMGQLASGMASMQQALPIQQELVRGNPQVIKFRRDLGLTQNGVGLILCQHGELDKGLKTFRDALANWTNLTEAKPEDTEFQANRARTLHHMGGQRYGIGDLDQAQDSMNEALAILQKLVEENPSVSQFQSDLALTCLVTGNLVSATGNIADALEFYQKSLEIHQKLVQDYPAEIEYQRGLTKVHINLGGLLHAAGRAEESMGQYQSALTLTVGDQLNGASRVLTGFQIDMAINHFAIGSLHQFLGNWSDARQSYELALAIREQLLEENPKAVDYQAGVASGYHSIAVAASNLGQLDESMEFFERSREIYQELADSFPQVLRFQKGLAGCHYGIGLLFSDTGRPDQVLESLKAAESILRRLATTYPSVIDYQSEMARTSHNIARQLMESKKNAEAQPYLDAAVEIWEELSSSIPDNVQIQGDLARGYASHGEVLANQGQTDKAAGQFEDALNVWQKLVDHNSDVPEFQEGLAGAHNQIGNILIGLDPEMTARVIETDNRHKARESYQAAIEIRRKLASEHPEKPTYAGQAGGALNNLAIIEIHDSQFREARKLLREAIQWQEKALESEPENPTYQKYLINHLNNLAVAEQGRGNSQAALEIRRKLAAEHPEMPTLANKLGGLLNDMATPELNKGNAKKARELLLEAIEWQKKALAAQPKNPRFRMFMTIHLKNLIRAENELQNYAAAEEAEREILQLMANDPQYKAQDKRLDVISRGAAPKDNQERLLLGNRAFHTKRFALCVKLFAEALDDDPSLAESRQRQFAYFAAWAAAKAASGNDVNDASLDADAKSKFRQQALTWLKAELERWKELLESGPAESRASIVKVLIHWQNDNDLAGVREPEALASMPQVDRAAFEAFWSDVKAVLKKTRAAQSKDGQ